GSRGRRSPLELTRGELRPPCYGWPMDRGTRRAVLALGLAAALGCAMRRPPADAGRGALHFPEDTFAFANDTIWEYDIDDATSHVAWRRRDPPPAFSLRCGTLARAVRQFYA